MVLQGFAAELYYLRTILETLGLQVLRQLVECVQNHMGVKRPQVHICDDATLYADCMAPNSMRRFHILRAVANHYELIRRHF